MGQRAQASTEYLVLLGAVLLVAVGVAALLVYNSGGSEDARVGQSALYWNKAYPIAIIEAHGYAGKHQVVVKNLAPNRIFIQGIESGNRSPLQISYAGGECDAPDLHNCTIPLAPGGKILLEYDAFSDFEGWTGMPSSACGLREVNGDPHAYWNSFKQYAQADDIRIYYSSSLGGAVQVESGTATLYITCNDYGWQCTTNSNCQARYSCTLGPCQDGGYCSRAC